MVCRAQLAQLSGAYSKLAGLGAEVLAIFPSPRASVDSLASELGAPFPILADEKGMVYDLYGVAKASLLSIYRPRALVGALKALAKGFLPRQISCHFSHR
ncbi:MAG: peroxiredoxin family protein [Nitrospinota bacterium]